MIYNNPADYGLAVVAELGNGGGYDWNVAVVWQHTDGTLYGGSDAGCSCTYPFQFTSSTSNLTEIRSMRDVDTLADDVSPGYASELSRHRFKDAVRRVLHAA